MDAPERFFVEIQFSNGANYDPTLVEPPRHTMPTQPRRLLTNPPGVPLQTFQVCARHHRQRWPPSVWVRFVGGCARAPKVLLLQHHVDASGFCLLLSQPATCGILQRVSPLQAQLTQRCTDADASECCSYACVPAGADSQVHEGQDCALQLPAAGKLAACFRFVLGLWRWEFGAVPASFEFPAAHLATWVSLHGGGC